MANETKTIQERVILNFAKTNLDQDKRLGLSVLQAERNCVRLLKKRFGLNEDAAMSVIIKVCN